MLLQYCSFRGDAPLILTPLTATEVAECERNKVTDIYAAIETDLLFASDANNLSKVFTGKNSGRATSLAAKALLGKVYLQEKKWQAAKQTLGELINTDNTGTHTLLPDIANVFSTAPIQGSSASDFKNYTGWSPQTMNKEILFEVIFNKDIAGEGRNALTYYSNQADLNEVFKLTNTAKCIYNSTDRRADLMRSMKGTNTDNNLLVKYADIQSSLEQYGYNTPILRWADVLLMYAEACNEVSFDNSATSPALLALNDVRTRSYAAGAYTGNQLSDQDTFRDAIFLERRLEFPMEMQRWFDLIRSGNAINELSKIGIIIDKDDLLFPIPNSEVTLRDNPDKFPQNPGY
ncbi:RagB/SusD family nutrient uptake outer membrane protein [Bacteroides sp. BFG-551]|nr:RagB/SusD family nutrient uptake outer membrane protein [Bacteroides sp. BFG-551]